MAVQDSYNQIEAVLEEFKTNHEKNAAGNKAAGTRARKAATELKKLLTEYRKVSIEASK
tara:strand:+ start:713 stop:889 length:177 start_codon:yes stop_codon:yes gene_type:complete